MRTRKWLALLLVLVMSLTMGGMTVFADESGDAGTQKPSPDQTESAEPTEPSDNFDDPSDSDTPDDPSGTTEQPNITMHIAGGSLVQPVIPGDRICYTVEIDAEGADMTGWYLLLGDELKAKVEKNDPAYESFDFERVELTGNMATIDYTIPEKFFISSSRYSINCILTDGEDEYGDRNILAQDYNKFIPAIRTLDAYPIVFKTDDVTAGKECPFEITWSNTRNYTVENFSTEIWTEICGGAAYENGGVTPTYKITEYPAGAVVKQGTGSATVEKINIPSGGVIRIAGTVLYPAQAASGTFHANELINGEFVNQLSTIGFAIGASTGTNPGQQPGTDENEAVKDTSTGITVSGVETGVILSVKSVSKEQQESIEETIHKLIGSTKGIKVFDISLLKDGIEVQPGAPVRVTIPIPEGFSTNLKLYHQNKKGELEEVAISVRDSAISFEAKSFSPYVLVDLGAKAANSSTAAARAPQTGDTSPIMLYLMLALTSMGVIGFVTKRRVNG